MVDDRFTIRGLSSASGVSVASIKFYLREGLLPAGDSAAAHRAHYDTRHLDRLRVIRALREVGQLPLATISVVLRAIDRGGRSFAVVASVMDALSTSRSGATREAKKARAEVRGLLAEMGVRTRVDAGAVNDLAAALVKLRTMWVDFPVRELRPYAEMAYALAKREVDANRDAFLGGTEGLLRTAVIGTVLFEPMLIALRRLMHEQLAAAMLQDLGPGTRVRNRKPARGERRGRSV